jgi:hypothetical protein
MFAGWLTSKVGQTILANVKGEIQTPASRKTQLYWSQVMEVRHPRIFLWAPKIGAL